MVSEMPVFFGLFNWSIGYLGKKPESILGISSIVGLSFTFDVPNIFFQVLNDFLSSTQDWLNNSLKSLCGVVGESLQLFSDLVSIIGLPNTNFYFAFVILTVYKLSTMDPMSLIVSQLRGVINGITNNAVSPDTKQKVNMNKFI